MPLTQVLNANQLIVGVDMHKSIPPWGLVHVIVSNTGSAEMATSKAADDAHASGKVVIAGGAPAVGRQHDLGRGIYHFGINALIATIWMSSGNKAEFGVASVKIPTGRIAAAVIPGGVNLQLDCESTPGGTGFAAPTSVCIACSNTVFAFMTPADIWAGVAAMVFDMVVVFISGKIVSAISGLIQAGVIAAVVAFAPEAGLAFLLLAVAFPGVTAAVLGNLTGALEAVLGWTVGSPLGYSFENSGYGLIGKLIGDPNDGITNLISPDPAAAVATVPSPAPVPGVSPPSPPPPAPGTGPSPSRGPGSGGGSPSSSGGGPGGAPPPSSGGGPGGAPPPSSGGGPGSAPPPSSRGRT
jgi:hypothetical protein